MGSSSLSGNVINPDRFVLSSLYTDGSNIPGTKACCGMKVFLFSFSLSIDFRSHFHFHDLDGVVVDGGKVWGEEFAEEVACSPHRLLFLFLFL